MAATIMTVLAALAMPAMADVTKEDLKKLARAGISEDVILSYVKANGPLARLSAEDLIELKQAGASENLLVSVLAIPATAPAYSPQPETRPIVVEKPLYSSATTAYGYDSAPYYYTPTSTYYTSSYYPSYSSRTSCYPGTSYRYGPTYHSPVSVSVHPSAVHYSVHSGGHHSSHSSGHRGHR
jgi:hypothetical protein